MPINGENKYMFNGNMETLARIDEAKEHYELEGVKAMNHVALKQQIARVRAALAQLDEVLGGTPGQGS